ncbi:MAG TPA: site-2 protease family protein [Thermoplasmata archaeon]|nr:site-2 protease family protein [Thermoplasmata archaeon]
MLSPEAEIETLRSAVARHFPVYGVIVTPLALTFQVNPPPGGIDAAFDALRQELMPKEYIPSINQQRGETLIHVQRRPKSRFAGIQVNIVLLFLTVLTTVFFGGAWNWSGYSGKPLLSAESIGYGTLFFTVPLLTILGSHEMGHYLVAKHYKVHASLPFFLPSLPPLGTFGAFISMRDPIPNRRALLDIGASGPLVGFLIALPVTLAGLALSAGSPPVPATVTGESINASLLFNALSLFFPIPNQSVLHPLAFAGWVGLFVTAINLLPAGQLDGGHVARALLGRNQFYLSWATVAILFGMSLVYPGWFIFGFLILTLGVRHPPPLNDLTQLDVRRKLIGIAAVGILLVTFVPVPFAVVSGPQALGFEAVNGTPLPEITQAIRIGTTVNITFAVNHTIPVRESVIVAANVNESNLASFGFSILFTDVAIGSNVTSVWNATVSVSLSGGQRAVLTLRITAPSSWPPNAVLPQDVTFRVHATTVRGTAESFLPIILHVTP